MAAIKFHLFRSLFDAEMHLLGALRLALPFRGNERIYGLHGLTLTFTAPAATVTFSDASGAGLLVKEVLAQIGGTAGLDASLRDQVVFVFDAARTVAAVLNCTTSTAAEKFGLPATGTMTMKKYAAPDGSAPRFIGFNDTGRADGYVVTTEE